MTFGAVFPPLAFSFFVTIYMKNHWTIFKLDQFIIYAKERNRQDYIDIIEMECKGCLNSEVIIRSVWIIICISSLFYTLFLFDTLGASNGVMDAYWVLIVMPLLPLFDYILYRLVSKWLSSGKEETSHGYDNNCNNIKGDVEVITIGVNPIQSI